MAKDHPNRLNLVEMFKYFDKAFCIETICHLDFVQVDKSLEQTDRPKVRQNLYKIIKKSLD